MLKVQEIRELIKLVDQSSISEFVYEIDDAKIKLKKNTTVTTVEAKPAVQQVVVEEVAKPKAVEVQAVKQETKVEAVKEEVKKDETIDTSDLHKVTSPMVGTFYQAPSPDSDPYVQVGSKVSNETIVCIVEAMKLFNEIEAEVNGEIVEILVKDGQLVEYGQPLFLVKPE
ncbi:acetyl-CoA carboxylase biotin carboxyl carrier protein [Bacillus aquiflavi]|uniref:Biotin carboxyl carrier protein of acetyl-CoA carboxylase n=1 Tax=Bacillus aquiflavi TaxID=2672567 RepID=A0A6B3VQB6_9BACI|nr:acetyl-CoA carboxylase biotin carboxyl carrier protein [Bacillus aquiflavi]MBA4535773.1 acetyl-CoA carboxylase biotin carboxyl carrier protein [Bacillus aquiflavi]NEY80149.1 acetyl-CoA carboxylase biotin carboxyl carrier protein [Bacillus aquiflavi]